VAPRLEQELQVELFRYATSVYGDREIIGGSFDLITYFVALGVTVILVHAIFKWVLPSNNNSAH
jgi:hypothetical protein